MSKSLKRFSAPPLWRIPVKKFKWVTRPSPGPHPKNFSIPLLLILRDVLRIVNDSSEARKVIGNKEVLVDGVPRTNYKFPVGLMDVLEIPKLGLIYRILPTPKKTLEPIPIPEEEKNLKLCRIENKKINKGNNIQLNLHDGRNVLLKPNITLLKEKVYRRLDSLLLTVPHQTLKEHVEFSEGHFALVVKGKHMGAVGEITSMDEGFKNATVTLNTEKGEIKTRKDFVMVIGEKKPLLAFNLTKE